MKSNTAIRTETKPDTVTRVFLASEILKVSSLSNRDALEVVDEVFNTIRRSLADGNSVLISRFGRWEVRAKAARQGRNPKTGAALTISARNVIKFHASDVLRKSLND